MVTQSDWSLMPLPSQTLLELAFPMVDVEEQRDSWAQSTLEHPALAATVTELWEKSTAGASPRTRFYVSFVCVGTAFAACTPPRVRCGSLLAFLRALTLRRCWCVFLAFQVRFTIDFTDPLIEIEPLHVALFLAWNFS